ncbi:MAG: 2-dehydro-3-deoxygalactonokinase [Pelagimonas sp.]|jgi:2-dehydro-3-deoxygalactonokinase|nr:2-dehydro-3-deoxygalactonokinase [Pelagimonas sp.]
MNTDRNRATLASDTQTAWIAAEAEGNVLRTWMIASDGSISEHREIDVPTPTGLEVFDNLVADQDMARPVTIVYSGDLDKSAMVSVPCKPASIANMTVFQSSNWNLYVGATVQQGAPLDLMIHEPNRIAGYLDQDSGFDGVLLLPGTHSKWVHISAEEIVSFRSFMTGEQFDLLAQHSSLKEGLQGSEFDQNAFDAGLGDTLSRPESLAAKLASLRSEIALNKSVSQAKIRARLLAYLIGAELAATRAYWLGQDVVILGVSPLAQRYQHALAAQGAMVRCVDDRGLALAGLRAAHAAIRAQA